jgi:SAM-dependent methyltransferase
MNQSGLAMDDLKEFKEAQKKGWVHFVALETLTMPAAARLVKHARVTGGQRVLDVACGTGVVAITAARAGGRVTGLDLTPELLERAQENARAVRVDVDWHEGDVEALPYGDGAFDVVLSQFGHIFAPRPDVAIGEMLRVLRRGGTIAFSTWPPELLVGRSIAIVGRYMPPPPPGVAPPPAWGDPNVVRERLGTTVKDLVFDRGRMWVAALSPEHYRASFERTAGPMRRVVESLEGTDPVRLEAFRREYTAVVAEYFEDNLVRQDYLLTRAVKL